MKIFHVLLFSSVFLTFPFGIGFSSVTHLIDTPTADVVDHYAFETSFRFYSEGGVLSKAVFGVFPRLNIGFGLDTEHYIGTAPVDMNRPTLNVKLHFFDGKRELPALAVGYDGQGYFFDDNTDKYTQREKGLYLAGSAEIIVPGLSLHGGINIFDFSEDDVYSFTGLHYLYQDTIGLVFEWDNIRSMRKSRLNIGGAYFVTPSFSVELIGRDLWAAGRKAERVIRMQYRGSF